MRTTVTIDDDVAAKLEAEMRRQQSRNFKQLLNDVLRRGLLVRRELTASKPFRVRARRMGKMQGLNYDNIGEMLEYLEGADHK
jgi:hypothetical protein